MIEWTRNSKSSSSSVVQTGNTWKLNYRTTNQYTTVTLNGYMDITVPEDTEYTFNYSSGSMWTNDRVRIYLDGKLLVDFSNLSKSGTETVLLTAGEHTIQLTLNKQNTATTSTYASITLDPISIYNHKCSECEIKENHIYKEKVIKEPTCTEKGEKELTCAKCGYSYIEEIPEKGGSHMDENDDNVCDKCGHVHIGEENVDSASWTKNATQSTSLEQNGNRWTLNYSSATQYTKFTSHGTWDIEVPMDIEYSFDYSSGSMWTSDRVRVYLDDELLVDFSDSSKSGTETILLTAGKHTLQMYLNKNNTSTSATYATITLNPIEISNHKCVEYNEKFDHNYAEGIVIKEPTCTEKGEKEFTCTKCNGTKTEEIDALGHNYVDGVCDRCGSLNLIKKRFWSAISSTSETEDTGGGHNDMATLLGTYSPNIEITEDMRDGEYLLLDFYVKYPFYGGQGHYGEVDGINGLSMLQKYNEETDTWETIYSYGLSYSTVGTNMAAQEGGYTFSPGNGIRRSFQLEKGTYRAYGRFSAGKGCGSSVAHHYYTYFISVDLCKVEKEVAETP